MPRVPLNNFLYDQVTINVDEEDVNVSLGSRQQLRPSVTEKKQDGNIPMEKLKKTALPQNCVKERLKQMQRVWSAMTKFISSQCANGRTVDLPLAGKFKRQGDEASQQFMFMPHLDFVGSGHFKFSENASNVSPFSKGSIGFQSALCTVSLTSLGAVCSLDRESVAAALKAVFVKFIEAGRSGKYCKLDMRIGHIVAYPNGSLSFENYPDSSQ